MALSKSELNHWISHRTLSEKQAVFNQLATEILKSSAVPFPILDEADHTIAYVVPPDGNSVPFEFQEWLSEPGVIEEIRRRHQSPASEFVPIDSFKISD